MTGDMWYAGRQVHASWNSGKAAQAQLLWVEACREPKPAPLLAWEYRLWQQRCTLHPNAICSLCCMPLLRWSLSAAACERALREAVSSLRVSLSWRWVQEPQQWGACVMACSRCPLHNDATCCSVSTCAICQMGLVAVMFPCKLENTMQLFILHPLKAGL
jgi:hypothetical protein